VDPERFCLFADGLFKMTGPNWKRITESSVGLRAADDADPP
jgi:hypothetical protein